MPELPEVETTLRGLQPWMENGMVRAVQIRRADLRQPLPTNFSESLNGQRIGLPLRRGKYMLFPIGKTHMLVVHLGMSGHMGVAQNFHAYQPQRHDHVIFEIEKDQQAHRIVFHDPRRFGFMTLLPLKNWQEHKPFAGMGLEPLAAAFDGATLYEALRKRKSPIKTALLDQRVVAGIGNIYACEALYEARIHPLHGCQNLGKSASNRLAQSLKNVLHAALESGGSTLRDYRGADGAKGYFQHQFKVYDRAGETCVRPRCAGVVDRVVQAGRSSFYCPRCADKVE
ncbi:MAG: bifunctional DNA-formamidopyrimidine glycosylase/DNA-(apurinic or apyrimidinic site) lyase [Alphaproteobacteria bacterium]|nr:bifunctional DNA-formamidopyrimidine glycosylase/DNA-(apurinic or apyrimidinic site) lyase [Alphaproteobacteria bacterium]